MLEVNLYESIFNLAKLEPSRIPRLIIQIVKSHSPSTNRKTFLEGPWWVALRMCGHLE